MNGVNQLGYLIIVVSDLEGWRGLSSSVLGLESCRATAGHECHSGWTSITT